MSLGTTENIGVLTYMLGAETATLPEVATERRLAAAQEQRREWLMGKQGGGRGRPHWGTAGGPAGGVGVERGWRLKVRAGHTDTMDLGV